MIFPLMILFFFYDVFSMTFFDIQNDLEMMMNPCRRSVLIVLVGLNFSEKSDSRAYIPPVYRFRSFPRFVT